MFGLSSPPDFTVDYRASKFPTGTIRPDGEFSFNYNELAHALFTTGRAPGDQRSHGSASVWEFIHRAALIPAYIYAVFMADSRGRTLQWSWIAPRRWPSLTPWGRR